MTVNEHFHGFKFVKEEDVFLLDNFTVNTLSEQPKVHISACTRITRWTLMEAWFAGGVVCRLSAQRCIWKQKKKWETGRRVWPVTREVFRMRWLLVGCSPGRLLTILGSFSTCQYKLITQAATMPHRCFQRHIMQYQTEERGHPNCPEYRIYFSKLSIAVY